MPIGLSEVLFALPILVVMAGIAAVIVWVIVRASRQPGRQPPLPGAAAARGLGRWNAHIRRDGHLDAFTGFGTLSLGDGVISFTPSGAASPAWSAPSTAVAVQTNPLLSRSDITIDSPMTGRVSMSLSHGPAIADTGNTFAALAEREAAGEFVQAMRVSGARILT